jgi:hypothetical protein
MYGLSNSPVRMLQEAMPFRRFKEELIELLLDGHDC